MSIEILSKKELKAFNSTESVNYQEKEYYFTIQDDLLKKLIDNYKMVNMALQGDIKEFIT